MTQTRTTYAMIVKILPLAAITVYVTTAQLRGDVIHVPTDYASIRSAVAAANTGDEVVVAPGTYMESDVDFQGERILLRSSNGRDETIIQSITHNDGLRIGTTGGVVDGFTVIDGTGVRLQSDANVAIRNCRFEHSAESSISGYAGHVRIVDCEFVGNRASLDGGAVFISSTDRGVVVRGSYFEQNDADTGGALRVRNSPQVEVRECLFRNNRADRVGGAAAIAESNAHIADCTFIDNDATYADDPGSSQLGLGGAVSIGSANHVALFVVERCNFEENTANVGGALRFAALPSSLYLPTSLVRECVFDNNSASAVGGAFHSNAEVVVSDSTFLNNHAAQDGGAVQLEEFASTVQRCELFRNSAETNGGAIYVSKGGSALIADSRFGDNAAEFGGAVGSDGMAVNLINSVCAANHAVQQGGAVRVDYGLSSVINCTFADNTAASAGQSFFGRSLDPPVVRNSIFAGVADDQIIIRRADPDVQYCVVAGGYDGEGNINANPAFVDAPGSDGVAGTEDDDLRLAAGSPAIDAGDSTALPTDERDGDVDCDLLEFLANDLSQHHRRFDDPNTIDGGNGSAPIVDIGAYEFDAPPVSLDLDCPSDVNQDGIVNLDDLAILLSNFGQVTGISPCLGDVTADQRVDGDDLADLLANFGTHCDGVGRAGSIELFAEAGET